MPARIRGVCWLISVLIACSSTADARHKVFRSTVRENGLVATYMRPKGDVARGPTIEFFNFVAR